MKPNSTWHANLRQIRLLMMSVIFGHEQLDFIKLLQVCKYQLETSLNFTDLLQLDEVNRYRRTGLKIWGRGADTNLPDSRQENFEKWSLFNAISCVLLWVFMHGASDKWKENIKNISETKHEQEDCPTLK